MVLSSVTELLNLKSVLLVERNNKEVDPFYEKKFPGQKVPITRGWCITNGLNKSAVITEIAGNFTFANNLCLLK
jgi:hypothetical protein